MKRNLLVALILVLLWQPPPAAAGYTMTQTPTEFECGEPRPIDGHGSYDMIEIDEDFAFIFGCIVRTGNWSATHVSARDDEGKVLANETASFHDETGGIPNNVSPDQYRTPGEGLAWHREWPVPDVLGNQTYIVHGHAIGTDGNHSSDLRIIWNGRVVPDSTPGVREPLPGPSWMLLLGVLLIAGAVHRRHTKP